MTTWKPINLEELSRHIDLTIHLLSEEEKSLWHFIRIEPEKWICTAYGTGSVEFFVVAIFGHRVIHYNDIEGGFNISEFKQYGKLESGGANQNDFHDFIRHLHTFSSSGKPWW